MSFQGGALKIGLMKRDLQQKLRKLGVTRGARKLIEANSARESDFSSARDQAPGSRQMRELLGQLDQMAPGGKLEHTIDGPCFVVDKVYPVSHVHGSHRLSDLLEHTPETAMLFQEDERIAGQSFRDFLFLDTETTGLMGAGVLAFLVGVAFFDRSESADVLIVRQYFLRDHGDEKAMLRLLDELLVQKSGLVTFNGQTFDIPLLKKRFLMNRLPDRFEDIPHIDLLRPARRLWRNRFGSVALGNLEKELLGIRRSEEDVPGWLIPTLYNDFLRSGDPRELRRVFYHNQFDMLSMVTLAHEEFRMLANTGHDVDPVDLFSLGKWQLDLGMAGEAEQSLRRAAETDLPLELYHQCLRRLGLLLKRNDRRDEAVAVWEQWAATTFDDIEAFEELAKYYEWHQHDLELAVLWTERAIDLINKNSLRNVNLYLPQLEHRLQRLKRKLTPS